MQNRLNSNNVFKNVYGIKLQDFIVLTERISLLDYIFKYIAFTGFLKLGGLCYLSREMKKVLQYPSIACHWRQADEDVLTKSPNPLHEKSFNTHSSAALFLSFTCQIRLATGLERALDWRRL